MLQAYFKTAAKRFIDSCVQDIDRALLQRSTPLGEEREFFIDNLLIRVHHVD